MRTHTKQLKAINRKINAIKLLFIIILIFQGLLCFQIHQNKTNAETIQPKANILDLEKLSKTQPPKIIPELEGIELETIINHESI